MEHGREIYVEDKGKKEKETIKSKLLRGKNWIKDHKGQVVIITLSAAALTTYASYYIFEGKSHVGYGDHNSQEKHTL